jgi:hypothetical protein
MIIMRSLNSLCVHRVLWVICLLQAATLCGKEVYYKTLLYDSHLQPIVVAKVNKRSVPLVFDTGANLLGLPAKYLTNNSGQEKITGSVDQVSADIGATQELVLGTHQMSNIKTASIDVTLFQVFFGLPCEGVFPVSILTDSLIRFDFDRKELELWSDHLIGEVPFSTYQTQLLTDHGCPSLEARIGDVDVNLLIDSGATGCVTLSERTAARLLDKKMVEVNSTQGKVVSISGVKSHVSGGRFLGGQLMGKNLEGVEFEIGEIEKIGMGWLVGFNFAIDLKNQRFFADIRKNAKPPIIQELMTGAVFRFTADGLVIDRLKPGGGAAQDAGIAPGDVLTSFGGLSMKGIDGYTFYDLVRRHSNSAVSFTVVKAGTDNEHTATLKLGDLISMWPPSRH